jgi:lipopolysaccharide/colanic/teichoic acid biosynthesis glycosyltransferase
MMTTVLVALLIAIAGRFMAEEVQAWFSWLHKKIRLRAVAKLPLECRERYDEEWESGLEEIPGEIFKLVYSVGLLRAAIGILKLSRINAVKCEALAGLPTQSMRYEYVKRAWDISFALILLILFAIPGLLIAAAILLSSMGGVFYRSERIGRQGRRFRIWKFRSMQVNRRAHERGAPTQRSVIGFGGRTPKDLIHFRVTLVGRFLRRSRLDELPQLFNVLRGEMSLVGPRPLVDSEAALYGDRLPFYLAATPGLSGLWQVSGRSLIGYDARAKIDALYVQSWSLRVDLAILLRTIPVAFGRIGPL